MSWKVLSRHVDICGSPEEPHSVQRATCTKWPDKQEPLRAVDSKVKSEFTRKYNKEGAALPYSIAMTVSKKKGGGGGGQDMMPGDEDEVDDEDEDCDTIEKDASIKMKKVPRAAGKSESSSSNGKGKGKG